MDVPAVAVDAGADSTEIAIGEINVLVDPIPYVASVENTSVTSGGVGKEDDDSLTERAYIAPSNVSVAGPVDLYEYFARSWRSDVTAAKPICEDGYTVYIFNDTTTAYVGAGYHGTTQRVAVPIAGTLRPRELLSTTYAKAGVWGTRQQESAKIIGILRPKDHKAATYAPVGCAAIRMQMTAHIKGNIRPADHKATTLAPAGIAAYRQQIEVRIGGINT